MRNTLFFWGWGPALVAACMVSAFPGCGSSSGNKGTTDAGPSVDSSADTGVDTGEEASSGDASGEASSSGGDTGTGCTATQMPQGMQILKAGTVSVQGVTSDGQVVYFDGSNNKLGAVPVAGGTPAMIGSWDKSQSILFTSNKVALYWNGATQSTAAHGALSAWTAGAGAKPLGTQSYFSGVGGGYVDVSSDGAYVLYTDGVTATSADIWIAGSDGSNKTKLVSNASIGASCRPVVRFAGTTAVVGYCAAQPDAGTTLNATVAAWAPPFTGTPQTFTAAGFYGFSVASVGTTWYVEYVTSAGMYVEAIGAMPPPDGGTAATLIDAKGAGGIFTHAGTDVLYFENDGSVWRSPVATPAPAELARGPFIGTLALSNDDKWLELFLNQDATGFTDMYLVTTTPADGGNTPATLASCTGSGSSMKCTGANFGDAFTPDSSQALFFPDVMALGTAGYVGTYNALALPPSAMPKKLGTNVWEEFATSGAKTLYNDNYVPNAGFAGAADIESIDLSTSAAAKTLVSAADANFFLTADKKTIVYSWSDCPGAQDGIYALAAP